MSLGGRGFLGNFRHHGAGGASFGGVDEPRYIYVRLVGLTTYTAALHPIPISARFAA
jgi:hypothetical protein